MVGGGYIALEFASIFHGLGVETTLTYRGKRLLRGFDAEIGTRMAEEMAAKGVAICFGCEPAAIRKKKCLEIEFTDGRLRETDLVMFATGRRPNTAKLGLESAGVKLAADGAVIVDRYSKTSVDSIHAVGDVTNRINLTPVATAEAMWLARTLFRGEPTPVDHDNVPTAVFANPNLATVGLSEEKARERYGALDIYKASFRALKLTMTDKKERTFMKLVVERASQRVVGAHMIGADAGEMIQGIAIAVKLGATKAQFDATIGIHPTAAEEFVTCAKRPLTLGTVSCCSVGHYGRHQSVWAAHRGDAGVPAPRRKTSTSTSASSAPASPGLTTAYLLARAGKQVVVLDDGPVAGGMTQVTTAHLTNELDDRYFEIEKLHGREGARLAAESHTAAIDRIETIVRQERIDCDFARARRLSVPRRGRRARTLERELEAAHRAGLRAVAMLERAPFRVVRHRALPALPEPGRSSTRSSTSPRVAQAIEHEGGRIFTDTHADQHRRRRSGGGAGRQARRHRRRGRRRDQRADQRPRRHPHQAGALHDLRHRRARAAQARCRRCCPGTPATRTTTCRTATDDLLIVGGEDHKTGQADDSPERYAPARSLGAPALPDDGRGRVRAGAGRSWRRRTASPSSAAIPMDHENVYVATGDSGMGMTHGTIAGMLLTDLILGRTNPWATLYDPSRVTLRRGGATSRARTSTSRCSTPTG